MVQLEDFEYDELIYQLQKAHELLDKLEARRYCFNRTQAKEDTMTDTHHIQVFVEDGTKAKEEYGVNRKVNVTLSSDIDDFDRVEEITERLSSLANRQVSQLLGRTSPPDLKVVGGTQARVNTLEPLDDGIVAPVAEKRKRRTAAEIAADAALAKAAHPKDPAAIDDEPPLEGGDPPSGGDDPAAIGDEPSEDDFNIEPETEVEVEEITDAALNAAVQRKNAELGDPEAIRGVIKLYNPDPTKAFQLREIPADKRADFITKLGGLVKSA